MCARPTSRPSEASLSARTAVVAAGGEGGLTLWKLDPRAAPSGALEGSRGRKHHRRRIRREWAAAARCHSPPGCACGTSASTARTTTHEAGRSARHSPSFRRQPSWRPPAEDSVWLGSPGGAIRRLPRRTSALAFDRRVRCSPPGDADGSVSLWDVARGRMLGEPLRDRATDRFARFRARGGAILAVASVRRYRRTVGPDAENGSGAT